MATPLETLPMSTAPSIYDQYRNITMPPLPPPPTAMAGPGGPPNLPAPPMPRVSMAGPSMQRSAPALSPPQMPSVSVMAGPSTSNGTATRQSRSPRPPMMASPANINAGTQAPRIDAPTRQAVAAMRPAGEPPAMMASSIAAPTNPMSLTLPQSNPFIVTGPKRGEEMYSNGQQILPGSVTGAKIEQQRDIAQGPGEERIYHAITGSHFGQAHPLLGKILGGLAAGASGVGDIGLDTFGGGMGRLASEMIPGTILNHQVTLNRDNKAVTQAEANAKDEAQTANFDAQPQLREQSAQLAQDKLDEKREHDQGTLRASLAQHGYAPDENNPGQLRPLRYDEMSPQRQAVTDLKGSQEELAEAQKAYKDAQTKNLPLQMQMAQQRILTAQQNARTAIARLGLSEQEFAFNQDKTYNPEPTAQERRVGDLAQSAVDRVHEMKQIVAEYPEYFGPGAGRATKFHAWIGSQDPDAQTFLSAARYLADHSAGVFGSRSVLITQQLEKLTDPDFNPNALNASLNEAERTATGFVNAGTPHGKGGRSSFKGDSGPPAGMVQVQIPGQNPGYIPSSALKQFRKDHPNAQVTQ